MLSSSRYTSHYSFFFFLITKKKEEKEEKKEKEEEEQAARIGIKTEQGILHTHYTTKRSKTIMIGKKIYITKIYEY